MDQVKSIDPDAKSQVYSQLINRWEFCLNVLLKSKMTGIEMCD